MTICRAALPFELFRAPSKPLRLAQFIQPLAQNAGDNLFTFGAILEHLEQCADALCVFRVHVAFDVHSMWTLLRVFFAHISSSTGYVMALRDSTAPAKPRTTTRRAYCASGADC